MAPGRLMSTPLMSDRGAAASPRGCSCSTWFGLRVTGYGLQVRARVSARVRVRVRLLDHGHRRAHGGVARAPPEWIVLRQPEVPAQALPVSDLGEGVVLLDGVSALHLHLVEQGREPRAAALAHLLELSLVQLWLFEDGETELRQLCCELAGAHRRRNQRWHGKDAGQHLARLEVAPRAPRGRERRRHGTLAEHR